MKVWLPGIPSGPGVTWTQIIFVMVCINTVSAVLNSLGFLGVLSIIIISWVKWLLDPKGTSFNKKLCYATYCKSCKWLHNQIQSSLPLSGCPTESVVNLWVWSLNGACWESHAELVPSTLFEKTDVNMAGLVQLEPLVGAPSWAEFQDHWT